LAGISRTIILIYQKIPVKYDKALTITKVLLIIEICIYIYIIGCLSVGYFAQKNTEILTELSMKLKAKASKIIDDINFVNVHDIKGYCEGKRNDGQSKRKINR
jgi:hypothetical protein